VALQLKSILPEIDEVLSTLGMPPPPVATTTNPHPAGSSSTSSLRPNEPATSASEKLVWPSADRGGQASAAPEQDVDGPIIALSLEDLRLSSDDLVSLERASRAEGSAAAATTTTAGGLVPADLNQAIDDIDNILHDVLTDSHTERSTLQAQEAQVRLLSAPPLSAVAACVPPVGRSNWGVTDAGWRV
jgi:hypothetical protein